MKCATVPQSRTYCHCGMQSDVLQYRVRWSYSFQSTNAKLSLHALQLFRRHGDPGNDIHWLREIKIFIAVAKYIHDCMHAAAKQVFFLDARWGPRLAIELTQYVITKV